MTSLTTSPASPDQTKGSIQANESPRLNAASQFRTPPLFPEISACADGLAALSGSPRGVSSLTCAAVQPSSEQDGGGSLAGRICAHCEVRFFKKPSEPLRDFIDRKFCDRACWLAHVKETGFSGTACRSIPGLKPINVEFETRVYAGALYTDDRRARADRGSPGSQASLTPNYPRSKDAQ
jgi:hypothetical protein